MSTQIQKTKRAKPKTSRQTSEELNLRQFAAAVGDFIRYWGFRKIHGQIWATVYLNNTPLSGADLTRKLKVSKALVSPALLELQKFELIIQTGGDAKTKLYRHNPKVISVIREILKNRELKLISTAQKSFDQLNTVHHSNPNSQISTQRLTEIEQMILAANNGINLILSLSQGSDNEAWPRLSGNEN